MIQFTSDMPVTVSVAMATFNGAHHLPEQLASLAAQTLPPHELVVSDDGSTDATLAVIRAFAATVPFPVRVLEKSDRLGFSDNFLFAVQHCRGELVALCDQDDAWLPAKLERGVARLLSDGSLLSMHQLTMTNDTLVPTQLWDQGIKSDRCWEPLSINPWAGWGNTMVFRRELASMVPRAERPRHPEAHRPLSHDTWLYILAAALGRVSHIAEPLILYRQHAANAFGMRKPRLVERLRTMATVPVESYRERDIFFGDLAAILAALAARETGERAAYAAAAAGRYRERQWRARTRASIHDGTGLARRAAAWWQLYSSPDTDQIGWRATGFSAGKDLLLGVTGWGTQV